MEEHWKPVLGYEELFEVSDLGRVRSLPRRVTCESRWGGTLSYVTKGKLLATRLDEDGYQRVRLWVEGRPIFRAVHHLVLEAFVGLRPEGMEARHFPDRDKTNNKLSNLSWGTPKENGADKVFHGTSGLGKKLSDEHRAAIAAGHVGIKQTPEQIEKRAAAHRGRKRSAETCARITAALIGRHLSEEHKEKISQLQQGRKRSVETCAAIAAGQRARWARRKAAAS